MTHRNREDDTVGTVATVAIGAAVAFGAYKLFGSMFSSNNPQQEESRSIERKPQTIPFSPLTPYRFPTDSKIYVVTTPAECKYAMRELKLHCDELSVLGFDCEWVISNTGREKVALIQLASHRGLVVLVRLSELGYIPMELEDILEDRCILKVGVESFRDAKYLNSDYGVSVEGTLDLRLMADMAGCQGYNKSLGFLADTYLGITLNKDLSVRCSNWEDEVLDCNQVEYAAMDAMVGIELFKFFAPRIEPNSRMPTPMRMRDVIAKCSMYLDQNYNKPIGFIGNKDIPPIGQWSRVP